MKFIPALLFVVVVGSNAFAEKPASPRKSQVKSTKSQSSESKTQQSDVSAPSSTSTNPELLGTKTFLEDLLARRYSQELASLIDRTNFSLAAQIDLVEVPPKQEPAIEIQDEPPPDLTLGTLDPEEVLVRYSTSDPKQAMQGLLKNHRITSVSISIGLKETLSAEIKAQVEKWITQRLNLEFGKISKSSVTYIREPAEKKSFNKPKDFWEWLNQFQGLAGQLVLAFAILLGTLLWKLIAGRETSSSMDKRNDEIDPLTGKEGVGSSVSGTSSTGNSATNPSTAAGSPNQSLSGSSGTGTDTDKLEPTERVAPEVINEINHITQELSRLNSKLTENYGDIVLAWCQAGEEGLLKLACFAEAVGKDIQKMPIPVDALPTVSRTFLKMPELTYKEKRNALQKTYWDILAFLSLGAESLQQPFAYLGGIKTSMLKNVLLEENPRMKALVSLYMPDQLRSSFVQSLSNDTKQALLEATAEMTEISFEELDSIDKLVKERINPGIKKNTISLAQGLKRLVASFSPIDEISLLGKMKGPAIEQFKRTMPSLAFLGNWKDEPLKNLINRATSDELLTYLRVQPEMKERILALCSPMTLEVVSEELGRPDRLVDKEKNRILGNFGDHIKQMISQKEIDLEQVFDDPSQLLGNVYEFKQPA